MTQKVYVILALFLLGGIENNAYASFEISNHTDDSIEVTLESNNGKHVGCKDKVVSLTPRQNDKEVEYHSSACASINTIIIKGPKGEETIEVSGFGVESFTIHRIYIKPGGWSTCVHNKNVKLSYKIDGIAGLYYKSCH